MGVGHHAQDITKLVTIRKHNSSAPSNSLIDEHQPRCSDQVIGSLGSPGSLALARKCLEEYGPGKRCIAICGAAGLGKTVLARLLLKEHGYTDFLEIDLMSIQLTQGASNDKTLLCRSIQEVDGYSHDVPLLLDGAESPAWTETSGISAMSRKRMAPTLVVCDETRKARSRTCDTVVLRRPTVAVMTSHMLKFFPDMEHKVMSMIVERARCDIRHVFQNLENFQQGINLWGNRDEFLDGTESITMLFAEAQTSDLEHSSRLAGIGDSHALVFENYLDAVNKDMAQIAAAADWMSIGDTVDNRLYHNQAWQLYDFRILAGSVMPACCVGPISGDVKPSTQRGKMSRRRENLKKKDTSQKG